MRRKDNFNKSCVPNQKNSVQAAEFFYIVTNSKTDYFLSEIYFSD